jgi:hypothetical protein
MSAQTGNKYAEKWTLERTLEVLDFIDSYACSNDCLYLNHALLVAGYYNDIWAYWRRKWRTNYRVMDSMKRILQRFEVRIFEKMAKKEMPANVGMFALRHHYGWGRDPKEQPELDLRYLDNEPMPETKPEPIAENKINEQPQDAPTSQTGNKNPKGIEYNRMKIRQYNAAHPGEPFLKPMAFFDGTPPVGMPAILFDDGFFMEL